MNEIEIDLTSDLRVKSDDPRIRAKTWELRPQTDFEVKEKLDGILPKIRNFDSLPETIVDELQVVYQDNLIEVYHYYADLLEKSKDKSIPKQDRPKLNSNKKKFFEDEIASLGPCIDYSITISLGYLGALRQVYAAESRVASDSQNFDYLNILRAIMDVIDRRKRNKQSEVGAGSEPCQPVAASMHMARSAEWRRTTKKR